MRAIIVLFAIAIVGCTIQIPSAPTPETLGIASKLSAQATPTPGPTPVHVKDTRPVFDLKYEHCSGFAACFNAAQFQALSDSLDAEERYDAALDRICR